jgi:hypothetical protein
MSFSPVSGVIRSRSQGKCQADEKKYGAFDIENAVFEDDCGIPRPM